MNRLASTGETADPCGVPRSRSLRVPSGCCIGAVNHRLTYSTTHGWSVLAATVLTIRSCGQLSKNAWMSRSSTQSVSQQRCRHLATRSEEHTSELQSLAYLVCRLL